MIASGLAVSRRRLTSGSRRELQPGEELTDLEDAFRFWRFRHVTTVERVIGFKRGTGGTGGVSHLRKMLGLTSSAGFFYLPVNSLPNHLRRDQGHTAFSDMKAASPVIPGIQAGAKTVW